VAIGVSRALFRRQLRRTSVVSGIHKTPRATKSVFAVAYLGYTSFTLAKRVVRFHAECREHFQTTESTFDTPVTGTKTRSRPLAVPGHPSIDATTTRVFEGGPLPLAELFEFLSVALLARVES